jgi:hypothetical protein
MVTPSVPGAGADVVLCVDGVGGDADEREGASVSDWESVDWGSGAGDADEQHATVVKPSRYRYRYVCSECHTHGDDLFDTPEEAQGNGLWHIARDHPQIIQVEPVGVYD